MFQMHQQFEVCSLERRIVLQTHFLQKLSRTSGESDELANWELHKQSSLYNGGSYEKETYHKAVFNKLGQILLSSSKNWEVYFFFRLAPIRSQCSWLYYKV
jgi:hypothetical protein